MAEVSHPQLEESGCQAYTLETRMPRAQRGHGGWEAGLPPGRGRGGGAGGGAAARGVRGALPVTWGARWAQSAVSAVQL